MTTLDKVIEVLSDISLIDEIRPEMTLFDLGLGMYERDVVKCILAVQNIHALTTVNDIVNFIESKGYETL